MALTEYTYTISQDFPGGVLNNPGRLVDEIRASAIVTALDHVDTAAGICSIWFKDALSAGDKTLLDGDQTNPAGGLIAAHNDAPGPNSPALVEVSNQPRAREDGVIYSVPKPSSFGYVMCDRDFKIKTCMVTTGSSVEDLKMNTSTNKEESWNELALVGVYKNVAGTMTLCADQADADANGVLSVWDYHAKMPDGTTPIDYELRDGLLYVDPTLPVNETFDHRAYTIVAPSIPGAYGGSITVFDAYLGGNPDGVIEALSPQAQVLDAHGQAGTAASTVRLYIVHPAGSKLTHVLRLVTYRAPGTF